ncbi:ATP phosphoribosyltransferase regulatory subunit [Sulfuriflexus sp.]|uniref:ATP phosphoribosyltransferase regulatory subunit n=1 Tax=Sulfuriflexus sp. TaxID=2015443 RepID=UPI0028CDFE6F|nr:ATP phosphoribosyltransferase regulatory subunit [Sulfuriflexus sp.]MDT8404899.1 ATP phosphoribosyltransferase regulatory subunit [Sulfuriflexus sp.]
MSTNDAWLLPEGIEELLPPQAERLERLHRDLIDQLHSWGYELVVPPFIDFLESLLTGTGNDLKLQTFTLTDQISGRLMGIRADMTPQVARIDARQLGRETPSRLCYLGTVLRTRPDGFAGSRSPLQCGAELYGSDNVESDIEIIRLMLATLEKTGIRAAHLDLAHVGIFRSLVQDAGLDEQQETELFDALQRKAVPEINGLLDKWVLDAPQATMLRALVDLNGGDEVLAEATAVFAAASEAVRAALDDLKQIAVSLQGYLPNTPLYFDLAELRGYHYHTGVMFSAYLPGHGQAIAWGGRYDDIGSVFGRARPATGFSTDLKQLVLLTDVQADAADMIFAPAGADTTLQEKIAALRAQGERVVCELPGQQGGAREMGCSRKLEQRNGQWEVVSV